jgi:Serine/threonine protein kinase
MIVEGLEQLHGEHKVIYQDLKPENIYFRDAKKTSLVLADFGISSIMKGYTKNGRFHKTPVLPAGIAATS